MRIGGTFNGTGATVYICCGFVPDWVNVFNFETSNDYQIFWNRTMVGTGEFPGGYQEHTGTTYRQITAQTIGAGILPYYGGELLTSTLQSSVAYGEGVYLKHDNADYRYGPGLGPVGVGQSALASTIDTWTLDTAGSNSGHFNEDIAASGSRIGEGSPICIDGKWYAIHSVTAGAGEAADEVVLSMPAKSGDVTFIGGMYSFAPIPVGDETREGFSIVNTTVNVNDALIGFEAGTWDYV